MTPLGQGKTMTPLVALQTNCNNLTRYKHNIFSQSHKTNNVHITCTYKVSHTIISFCELKF